VVAAGRRAGCNVAPRKRRESVSAGVPPVSLSPLDRGASAPGQRSAACQVQRLVSPPPFLQSALSAQCSPETMGPTFFLHVRASSVDSEAVNVWLLARVRTAARTGTSWEFGFAEETCLCSVSVVPFGAEASGTGTATDSYLTRSDLDAYNLVLGYTPATSFQFDSYSSSDDLGHRRLAQMSADLADVYEGFVELDGDVYGPVVRSCPNADVRQLAVSDGTVRTLLSSETMRSWSRMTTFFLPR
jgi:hypothetical protein